MGRLSDLDVMVLDCQASGATPELGDVIELGWTRVRAGAGPAPPRATWVVPRSGRAVPRIVRKLTGWSDECLGEAIDEKTAWERLVVDADAGAGGRPAPAVIHYARFEFAFLRDMHARYTQGDEAFPFDALCLHAIARRLHPDLPRRGLRALAGFLGHPAETIRRAAGHVEASAFVWRAFVPALEKAGVTTWEELRAFVAEKAPARPGKRTFPLPAATRRALPARPGVYRFVRASGDVLYVGKAASIRHRVASHFTGAARVANERTLEMLTQVSDVRLEETATALEAALLEADEIKRLDPPYNVQLREGDRRAWFASRDWLRAAPAPDDEHAIGPLPSADAVSGLGAIRLLASGADPSLALVADALGVPRAFAPDEGAFREAWRAFAEERAPERVRAGRDPRVALLRASIGLEVPGSEDDDDDENDENDVDGGWTAARVRRGLDRTLARGGQLLRRARWLALLADAAVVFREKGAASARLLVLAGAEIVARGDHEAAGSPQPPPLRRPRRARQACFDAARYDRVRVLRPSSAACTRRAARCACASAIACSRGACSRGSCRSREGAFSSSRQRSSATTTVRLRDDSRSSDVGTS